MCKTDAEGGEIQRTDILITLSPKDSVFSGYLLRNIGLIHCLGGGGSFS